MIIVGVLTGIYVLDTMPKENELQGIILVVIFVNSGIIVIILGKINKSLNKKITSKKQVSVNSLDKDNKGEYKVKPVRTNPWDAFNKRDDIDQYR